MEHFTAFKSSHISLISYDAATKTLQVTWHDGDSYLYFNVSKTLWLSFKKAESKGRFMNLHIKNKHRFRKV